MRRMKADKQYGSLQQLARFGMGFRIQHPCETARAQHAVIGIEVRLTLVHGIPERCILHLHTKRGRDHHGDFILKFKDIGHFAVVTVAPKLDTGCAINQFH